ncbi:hypothetical protein B0H11DRAFT_1899759 [Mycena galericulata]|nr:hypothetical protein B0H11DRAFT_1899759 [Mycena galericulata]
MYQLSQWFLVCKSISERNLASDLLITGFPHGESILVRKQDVDHNTGHVHNFGFTDSLDAFKAFYVNNHVWAEKYFYFKIISYYNTRKPKADSKTEGSKTHKPKKMKVIQASKMQVKKLLQKPKYVKVICIPSAEGNVQVVLAAGGGKYAVTEAAM